MANCGVPAAPAIILMMPRYRMVSAHPAATIRCFVDTYQNGDVWIECVAEVIPLVRSLPDDGQMASRRVRRIDDLQRCRLNRRMPLEIGSHQSAIPRPLVPGVACSMDADESAAVLNEPFERRALVGFQNFPGRVQENHGPVPRQIGIGKYASVFACFDAKTISFA